jgi:hypothetical protein
MGSLEVIKIKLALAIQINNESSYRLGSLRTQTELTPEYPQAYSNTQDGTYVLKMRQLELQLEAHVHQHMWTKPQVLLSCTACECEDERQKLLASLSALLSTYGSLPFNGWW